MITERGMSDPVLYGNWCLWNPNFRSKESLWLRWRITIIIMKSLWNLASNVGLPFMYLIQVKFSLCCVLFVLYFVVLSDFRELTNIFNFVLFFSISWDRMRGDEIRIFLLQFIMFIHRTSARDRRRMREACICSCFTWTASTFPFFCLFGKIFVNNKQRREEIHK